MFSDFKYIDVNLKKDITKGPDSTSLCTWFTILAGVVAKIDKDTGEEKITYEYFSFPSIARFGVEEDYVEFSTEGPYLFSMAQFGFLDF